MKAFQDFVFAIDKRLPIKYEDAAAVADLTRDAIALVRRYEWAGLDDNCIACGWVGDVHGADCPTSAVLARAAEQGVE